MAKKFYMIRTMEYVQWTGNNIDEIEEFVESKVTLHEDNTISFTYDNGTHISCAGEYIMKDEFNTYYICHPERYNKIERISW